MPFEQNYNGYTFEEFRDIALKQEINDNHIDWSDDEQVYDLVEKQFWDYVEN